MFNKAQEHFALNRESYMERLLVARLMCVWLKCTSSLAMS